MTSTNINILIVGDDEQTCHFLSKILSVLTEQLNAPMDAPAGKM